ncbi:MAG: ABC transporter permease, partial [Lentisphaeria bacterium]|nr:ABC transporter permease [Lentisphaeria bacterium]
LTLLRLGKTQCAVVGGERLFLADMGKRLEKTTGKHCTALLHTRGSAKEDVSGLFANNVQIYGVAADCARLAPTPGQFRTPAPGEAVVSKALLRRIGADEGDTILLKMTKPSAIPRDAALAQNDRDAATLRLRVAAVVSDEGFGRLGLGAQQLAPLNVFVSRKELAKALGLAEERANLVLSEEGNARHLENALAKHWKLEDVGLTVRPTPDGAELISKRVFIDPSVENALAKLMPPPRPTLTYFVNEVRCGAKTSPFAFAAGMAVLPDNAPTLHGDDALINRWLADDLDASIGDEIELSFVVSGALRTLQKRKHTVNVRGIVPLEGTYADQTLMPDLPGLSDADSCTDWDPGIPIDTESVRPKDEDYWEAHRGTPKIFVALDTAKKLWSTTFGASTALRFQGDNVETVTERVRQALDPQDVGLQTLAVRESGLQSSSDSVDFGQLFLGLSFFVIASALLLAGLLFSLSIRERADQVGTLLALGWHPRRVRMLLFMEGSLTALVGVAAGIPLALLYNRAVTQALSTVWRGTVGTADLVAAESLTSIAIGVTGSLACTLGALWLVATLLLREKMRRTHTDTKAARRPARRWVANALAAAVALALVAVVCASWKNPGRGKEAMPAFFATGALALVAGLFLVSHLLNRLSHAGAALSLRNCSRRPGRSLALVGCLASAVFLVIATAANRHGTLADAERRSSGTGGFAFHGATSVPVPHDLNEPKVQKDLILDLVPGLEFVQFSVAPGDEASCLNLNRVTRPQILGVDPQQLASRGAFRFVGSMPGIQDADSWHCLDATLADGSVPAVADLTAITWGLGRKIGEILPIQDEMGRTVNLRLVGGTVASVLQGNVLISRTHFQHLFPSFGGTRVLLVDCPPDKRKEGADALRGALHDYGLDLIPCTERLAGFHMVENTYLDIFLALGALGLVLGSVGLACVLVRNALERRSELALLRATGFSLPRLSRMLLAEHAFLLILGVLCGTAAGITAILPAIASPDGNPTPIPVALMILAVLGFGLLWVWLAARLALRGPLLPALRDE